MRWHVKKTESFDGIGILLPEIEVSNVMMQLKRILLFCVLRFRIQLLKMTYNSWYFILIVGHWYGDGHDIFSSAILQRSSREKWHFFSEQVNGYGALFMLHDHCMHGIFFLRIFVHLQFLGTFSGHNRNWSIEAYTRRNSQKNTHNCEYIICWWQNICCTMCMGKCTNSPKKIETEKQKRK